MKVDYPVSAAKEVADVDDGTATDVYRWLREVNIESYWGRVKRKIKNMKGCHATELELPSYLDKFMWKEQYGKTKKACFRNICTDIATFYPVYVSNIGYLMTIGASTYSISLDILMIFIDSFDLPPCTNFDGFLDDFNFLQIYIKWPTGQCYVLYVHTPLQRVWPHPLTYVRVSVTCLTKITEGAVYAS